MKRRTEQRPPMTLLTALRLTKWDATRDELPPSVVRELGRHPTLADLQEAEQVIAARRAGRKQQ
ncbi:hypothetical protein SAMN05216207_107812 [Pseudonocardia ammonioxydans]|uniref:Uncharacterized protein n=1 Tax=Pseudonocardia ammonioxydans TaxID=260086 RepID=A0A1I5HWQ0_PSUAM|nr:hypothetical protein [Pseudonocardia ammonioxydans]SFO52722.1 hypothetical protein SAMN05216207_107812 [Pseudonocardia ammonioxydans]